MLLDLFGLGNDSRFEFGLLIVLSKTLCADSLSAVLLAGFLFLLFFKFPEELFILLAFLIVLFVVYFGFVLSYAINVNVTNLGLGIVVDKPDDVRGSVFKDFLDEGFDDGVN